MMRQSRRLVGVFLLTSLCLSLPGRVSSADVPDVAPRFATYYAEMDGPRLLGGPISEEIARAPFPRQFFEKGLLEDHGAEGLEGTDWQFMYALLVDELQSVQAQLPVGGDVSTVTYADIHRFADPGTRSSPPIGSGPAIGPQGMVFVPYTTDLSPGPGQYIPHYFWIYLNRSDLFPAGWLHDVGLPLTPVIDATVDKGPYLGRRIKLQAFQRAILTYDPQNPSEWQIERANVGTDYLRAFPIAAR